MNDYKKLSDLELIRLLQASDHGAYTEIYNRYFRLLYVHAVKKLRDEDQAKDILHELFTKLWIRRETNLTDINFAGYLYTLLRNRILDFLGHQLVKTKYVVHIKTTSSIHSGPRTDALIREKEMNDYINKEIDALPTKMREIFILSRKEELSYREIAEKLNTTENNVSKQVNNGLRILRGRLGLILYFYFILQFLR
ncbi:RNA polymerase sigma-70 factor [Pedobacter nyackensis]|uniref:RNA polymerase sigma-70 factor n=1 Tax=Pedobacter nyackensis TaxID=475255 RepID=UPI00292F1894|nr:RNA polymerase sigma-70 factor [Pedobacter nyackensis]